MRLALFQPDIPQNLGAAIRLCACLGVPLAVIEPCAFPLSEKAIRCAALDYGDAGVVERYDSWTDFLNTRRGRVVLFTTKGAEPLPGFCFQGDDTLLMGRESAGVPDEVHSAANARVFIPIRRETRSLNVVTAAAIGLSEALRQTGGYPVQA
jgi:tRNA (cytidine/uridine-2'-O-)-methyltransferase